MDSPNPASGAPTNPPTNQGRRRTIVTAVTTAPSAEKRPRKRWLTEKREVCAAIADAARRHNQPPLQDSGYKILAPLVGHLLNGGYDLVLIRRVAVEATLDYDELRRYSKLFQLRMRVRSAQNAIDLTEHERIKRESADAVVQADPEVAKAFLVAAKRMLEGRDTLRAGMGE